MTSTLHPLFSAILQAHADAQIALATTIQQADEAQRQRLQAMPEVQLIAEAERLAGQVSYYNAAEGEWGRETDARGVVNSAFSACRAELQRRGLVFVNDKGYLL
jgi:hypothetical protein